jgi:undecaprenyl diphosphate synthase
VAIVMDGNGRWAEKRGKNRSIGHIKGAEALRPVVENCPRLGIGYLTVYAFSSENWIRPPSEVCQLMGLFEEYILKETHRLHEMGVNLRFIGNRHMLPDSLQKVIAWAEKMTESNTVLAMQVALNYGARDEIVNAARKLACWVADNQMAAEDITCERFASALETTPWPDPDLFIRTGGDKRLSNCLLWQLSYTELIFLDIYWPEFTVKDLERAIETYYERERRFGGITCLASSA